MQVKIKKLNSEAMVPVYAQNGDAGLDLTAISVEYNAENNFVECGTGLAIEIPSGYVGLVFSRSSVSKKNLVLANGVGVIDSGYRGEIRLRFKPCGSASSKPQPPATFTAGEKVGQLLILPYPTIELVEVPHLSDTDRGEGGFGSTGR